MRNKTFFFLLALLASTLSFAQVNPKNHVVNSYQKSNGVYVESHHRTNQNSTINDNYTTKPNVNPYTGKAGTIEPSYNYSTPKISTPSYNYTAPKISTPSYNYTAPKISTPSYNYTAPKISTPSNHYTAPKIRY